MKSGQTMESVNLPGDPYFWNHIANISESDFWSAWQGKHELLRKACRLGKSGKREAAYLTLAEYHRLTTVPELDHEAALARERASTARKRREVFAQATQAYRGTVSWQGQFFKLGRRMNFNYPFGSSSQYGVHYLVWLGPLVDRYVLQGKPGDLDRLSDIVCQYYDQRNGIDRTKSWYHPVYYELGSWAKTWKLLPAYLAMIHSGQVNARAAEAFLKLFLGFGRSLLRIEECGYRSGNHQIVAVEALMRLGAIFHEFREAPAWRKRAKVIMFGHTERDFYPDGGHKERCWSYGWMSLKGVIDFYETGLRTGFLTPTERKTCLKSIQRAFRWFTRTLTPTGLCPAYGDGDLFKADEILDAAKTYLPAQELCTPYNRSLFLKDSGYAVMRDDGSPESRYLNVNFGEYGGGHTHSDLLDFNLWAFGEPLIEEVGRFDSYDHPLNPFFYSVEAHNQIVLDDHPMNRYQNTGHDVVWRSIPELDYLSAWHEAFHSSRGPVRPVARVRRHILFLRKRYFLIYDVVEPKDRAGTIFSISSYLHSPWPIRVVSPTQARLKGKRAACAITFAPVEELRRLEAGVDIAKKEVTAERIYDERYHLRARAWGGPTCRGNLRLGMLLYPYAGKNPKVGIRELTLKGPESGLAAAFEVTTPAGRDVVVFNPDRAKSLRLGGTTVRGILSWQGKGKRITLK